MLIRKSDVIFKNSDLVVLGIFLIALMVLFYTTNQIIALAIVITITTRYTVKHYQLRHYIKKHLMAQIEMLEKLFNSSTDLIAYIDTKYKIISWNSICATTFGCVQNDMLGQDFSQIFKNRFADSIRAENIWAEFIKHIEAALQTGNSVKFCESFIVPERGFTRYSILASPAYNEDCQVCGIILVARDVTAEYLATKIAQDKEKQLHSLLENMPICAYMKDKDGHFIIGSSSFVKLLNLHNAKLSQLVISDIFEKEYLDFVEKEEKEIYITKQPLVVERQINLQGQSFFARVRKAPVINSEGEVDYMVVMYENIETERELERQKEYFIETLIHDLKVPTLAQLRGLELLQNDVLGKTNDDQKDLVVEIIKSCKYILEMISRVLQTYRFENRQKSLCFEVFSLADLLLESFNKVSSNAQEKNVQFVYASTQDDTMVEADRKEIKKVIVNLLISAISYSDKNEKILVNISTDNNQIKLSIKSHGISLSERECLTMFEKFELNSTRFTSVGGGIGLYLCKKIIDIHDGTIYANTAEKTNIFTFIIPQYRHESTINAVSPLYI